MVARPRASEANSVSSSIENRRSASDASRRVAMLVTRYIGNSGSMRADLPAHAVGQRLRRPLAADHHGEGARRKLQVRQIHRRARVGVERVLLHRRRPRRPPSSTARWSWRRSRRGGRAGQSDPGRATTPSAMRSSITTTRGALRMSSSPNSAPAPQRNLHRAEVVGADDPLVDVDERLAGLRDAALDGDRPPRHHLAQRQRRHPAHAPTRRAAPPRASRSPDTCRARRCRRRTSARSSSTRA